MTARLVGIAMLVALLTAGGAQAHEIGTTLAHLALHSDRTWSAEITTAPTALINRLEAEARQPLSRDLTAETTRERLTRLLTPLARHIDVRFDGAPSPASVTIARVEIPPDILQPAFVVLRATGAVPEDAQSLTWRYGLVFSTYGVTFVRAAGEAPLTQWIEGDAASRPFPIAGRTGAADIAATLAQYAMLGFRHIVPEGLDHILFVLGIFLLTTRLKPILVQVTAFTLAHSLTLGLTLYGAIALPSRIVEPLIALSIAYVAIENILTSKLTPWRPAVVFGFGLLHGMGFAGILTELRPAREEIVPALIGFNAGIELAQLTVIAAAYLAVAAWASGHWWYRARLVVPASAVIAAIGLFWTVERLVES